MRVSSDTLLSKPSRRRGGVPFQISVLVLLALVPVVLLLAMPLRAEAATEAAFTLNSVAGVFTPMVEPATVTNVEPKVGPLAGGTKVTITGTNLTEPTEVKFGPTKATSFKVISASSIEAVSPAGTGTVDLIVTTPGGPSATSSADQFTYTTPSVPGEVVPGGGGAGSTGGVGPLTPLGLPAPVLAQSANVAPVAGRVLIRLPGKRTFATLSRAQQIPYRTIVEATHGEVSIAAAAPGGGTQTSQFFDGQFVLTQRRNGRVLATLSGGDFSACPSRAQAASAELAHTSSRHASGTHLVRRLWANAGGSFSTKGNYATGVVQDAQWLTEDMCEGTLILATRDRVQVTDLVRHRPIEVDAGHIYLAKPK
jgi:hypothetical protein